jgi:rhodanese-related sulfurtransferase
VKTKLDRAEAFTLLHVHEPWELDAAQIGGPKWMPMGDVPSRARQEPDPDHTIVFVCHHGGRSMNVTAWLPTTGLRKSAVDTRRDRRLVATGGPKCAIVLNEAMSNELRATGNPDRSLLTAHRSLL